MSTPELTANVPCYLLLRDDGTADIVVLGNHRCLCVFTDERRIKPFYEMQYGMVVGDKDVGTLTFDGPEQLRAFLRANEAGLAAQGVQHLAIDPHPKRLVGRVPVRAFIEGKPPGSED